MSGGCIGESWSTFLGKNKKSMTKASKRIKGIFLKEERVDIGKSRKVFQRGRFSFLLWSSEKL